LASRISGRNIAELSSMQVSDLAALVRTIRAPQAGPMLALAALAARLENLVTIGLGYLSLDRESSSLSGGESQRVKMVRHLGSSLTDITYIFDEPSVGLHPHDVGRMAGLMRQLRDKGNTVLIVEHKPDMIAIADHVEDMGPLAGSKGGEVVYEGDFAGLLTSGTLTGNHMKKHQPIKDKVRKPSGELRIKHARLNNLKHVSVTIPKGVLTAVSGVAGSGKTSLIVGCLPLADPETIIMIRIWRAARGGPTRPPIPAFSTMCARPSPRPTRWMRRCSRPIPRGRARTATGWASSIPTSAISTPWSPPARPAMASASCPKCWSTGYATNSSATSLS
jgi:excinuclease UvrABC ATPase subunit